MFYETYTNAERVFGSGCFHYSAPVREPKHIGARPKGHSFLPRLRTEAIESPLASVLGTPEAIWAFLIPFWPRFWMHPRPYGTASSSRVPARRALESPTNPLLGSPNPDTEIPVFCPQKHNRVSCNNQSTSEQKTPRHCWHQIGSRFSQMKQACPERACERDRARERERRRDAKWRGLAHWPEVVAGGRRWSTVVGGCGGSGCNGERESTRERERARERARERKSARWWPEEEVAWWLH